MNSEKFGKFISEMRRERGMTQEQLARKISVTNKAVSRWETGLGFPDINTLEPLAEALGVSILELMRSERVEQSDESGKASQALSDAIELANLKRDRREFIIAAVTLSLVGLMLIALAVFVPSAPTVWTLSLYILHNFGVRLPALCRLQAPLGTSAGALVHGGRRSADCSDCADYHTGMAACLSYSGNRVSPLRFDGVLDIFQVVSKPF